MFAFPLEKEKTAGKVFKNALKNALQKGFFHAKLQKKTPLNGALLNVLIGNLESEFS